jgi:hypothetical protein
VESLPILITAQLNFNQGEKMKKLITIVTYLFPIFLTSQEVDVQQVIKKYKGIQEIPKNLKGIWTLIEINGCASPSSCYLKKIIFYFLTTMLTNNLNSQILNLNYIKNLQQKGFLKLQTEEYKYNLATENSLLYQYVKDEKRVILRIKKGTICEFLGRAPNPIGHIYKCSENYGHIEIEQFVSSNNYELLLANKKMIFLLYEFKKRMLTWYDKEKNEHNYACFLNKNVEYNFILYAAYDSQADKIDIGLAYCGNDATSYVNFDQIIKLGKNHYRIIDSKNKIQMIIMRKDNRIRLKLNKRFKEKMPVELIDGNYKIILEDNHEDHGE